MSTSCKPEPEIHPFPYSDLPVRAGGPMPRGTGTCGAAGLGEPIPLPEETRAEREAAARQAGRGEGEAASRAAFNLQLAEIRGSVRAALGEFARERTAYYQQVEAEVVQLALSMARKILRREAQIDPLLLAGMVRVALERIESGTKVVVRVNPQQVSECRAYFAQHMEAREAPEVLEDPNLPAEHCILQTSLGTTELGPEVQLKEIEQGLFDLLERRPRATV